MIILPVLILIKINCNDLELHHVNNSTVLSNCDKNVSLFFSQHKHKYTLLGLYFK